MDSSTTVLIPATPTTGGRRSGGALADHNRRREILDPTVAVQFTSVYLVYLKQAAKLPVSVVAWE